MAAPRKTQAQTVTELQKKADVELREAEQKTLASLKKVRDQEKIKLSLAPQYRAYFGDVMTVGISGLNIYFPVDGRAYEVPKDFAKLIQERRRKVDDFLMRTNRLANVQANRDDTSAAGSLELIPR